MEFAVELFELDGAHAGIYAHVQVKDDNGEWHDEAGGGPFEDEAHAAREAGRWIADKLAR